MHTDLFSISSIEITISNILTFEKNSFLGIIYTLFLIFSFIIVLIILIIVLKIDGV